MLLKEYVDVIPTIREKLDWDYKQPLVDGIRETYEWILFQKGLNSGN